MVLKNSNRINMCNFPRKIKIKIKNKKLEFDPQVFFFGSRSIKDLNI